MIVIKASRLVCVFIYFSDASSNNCYILDQNRRKKTKIDNLSYYMIYLMPKSEVCSPNAHIYALLIWWKLLGSRVFEVAAIWWDYVLLFGYT